MNYVPDNLNRIIRTSSKNKEPLPLYLVKIYSFQVIRALGYMHNNHILHRDIKPQNILVDSATNKVFVCDLGSAKKLSSKSSEKSVAYICSRYYRAPELIFSTVDYSYPVDIWSFGCLLAEMVNGKPLMQGADNIDQLLKIFGTFGLPSERQVQILSKNNESNFNFPEVNMRPLAEVLANKNEKLLDLLLKIFVYEPSLRLKPHEIMAHPFYDDLRNEAVLENLKVPIPKLFNFTEGIFLTRREEAVQATGSFQKDYS